MKKLFTLLAALLFLGGLMAQESNYYLYLSEWSWDDGDRFNLEWNNDDEDYQLEQEFDSGIYEFMIVTLDGDDPTFALGYSNVDLEASCAGIREGEDNKIKVIITSWYAGLKIHVNAEGNRVVIECVYDCENIITADYVLLFRENGAWDLNHPVLMENNTASVTKSAGTYQFAVVPTVDYYDQINGAGGIEYDHTFHFDDVNNECSSRYYREGEDGSVKVTLAERGDISVTVNGSSLCVEGNFAGPEYFLVGSFCDWDLDLAEPMYDNTYTDYLAVGTHEFKVVTPAIISGEDTNWTSALGYSALDPECSSENIQEGTNGNFKVTISESGSDEVTVQYLAGYVCVTGEFVIPSAPTITSWTVAGGAEIAGVAWDPTATVNDMTESNGVWTLVKTGVEIATAGTYYYKVAANHSWEVSYPAAGNQSLYIYQPGTYTITYTWVPSENSLTATAVEQTTWTIAGEEAIAGAVWNAEYTDNDMIGSDGTWTLVKQNVVLTELRNYYYKVARNHSWEVSYPADGNQTLAIYKRGTYNITYTWVPATSTLTAEATWLGWPTDIENADATTVRKLIENGQLVIIRDGKRYNATGQLVK